MAQYSSTSGLQDSLTYMYYTSKCLYMSLLYKYIQVRRGYIVKFAHPMYFSLRRAKERSIRTRPSTVSPRNCFLVFLLSRRCRHQPTAMDGRAEKVSTGWERCKGVILLNFHTPCIFPFVGLKNVYYNWGWTSRNCITFMKHKLIPVGFRFEYYKS
jgi:hypothetical protein